MQYIYSLNTIKFNILLLNILIKKTGCQFLIFDFLISLLILNLKRMFFLPKV